MIPTKANRKSRQKNYRRHSGKIENIYKRILTFVVTIQDLQREIMCSFLTHGYISTALIGRSFLESTIDTNGSKFVIFPLKLPSDKLDKWLSDPQYKSQ